MSCTEQRFLDAVERHSADGIAAALDAGLDARAPLRGKPLTRWLTEMYTRSDRFPACLRVLLERGAALDDPKLAPVLLDDAPGLARALDADPALPARRTTLASAFTPLEGATLLHVAAEFGHLAAARVLVERGAEIDARAAPDPDGLGGHTPLFHTVNSNENRSAPLMRFLLESGARADVRVAGLVWGRGFEWETVLFDLTPISYAQCGLLPQFHRDERQILDNVRHLLQAAGRRPPTFSNVPNRYL
jgi:ankyrin repeat protein